MEMENRKRRKKRRIQEAVLAAVGVVGIIGVGLIAASTLRILPEIAARERSKFAFQARTAFQRLLIKGHIRLVEVDGRKYAEITDAGRRTLMLRQSYSTEDKRRRWDRRYRIVAFDIPEKRRHVRDNLRNKMGMFGFLQIQKSLWVYPYDCEELVVLLKADLRVGKDVLYLIVESIENDRWIKNHFGLK